jgi:hypothetical protein
VGWARPRSRPRSPWPRPGPAAGGAPTAGVDLEPSDLEALEAARRFRLDRHALSAEQIERLAAELPLPHLLVPMLEADAIGPTETETLAVALAGAVTRLEPEPTVGAT